MIDRIRESIFSTDASFNRGISAMRLSSSSITLETVLSGFSAMYCSLVKSCQYTTAQRSFLWQPFVDGKSMTQSEPVAEGFSEVVHSDCGTVVEVCNGSGHF